MKTLDQLNNVRPANRDDEETIRQATEALTNLKLVLNWFGDSQPNSYVNKAAELLRMSPNDFKDKIADEARRLMFVRSVK